MEPLIAVAVGCVLGVLRGGRLRSLADLHLRHVELPIAGVLALVLLHLGPGRDASATARAAFLTASIAPVIVFLWLNRRLRGLALVAAGLLLNLAVILPNGGMPVSSNATRVAGIPDPAKHPDVLWGKHVVMGGKTALRPLGDVIPVPFGPFANVISIGDILVLAGIAWVVEDAVARKPTPYDEP